MNKAVFENMGYDTTRKQSSHVKMQKSINNNKSVFFIIIMNYINFSIVLHCTLPDTWPVKLSN